MKQKWICDLCGKQFEADFLGDIPHCIYCRSILIRKIASELRLRLGIDLVWGILEGDKVLTSCLNLRLVWPVFKFYRDHPEHIDELRDGKTLTSFSEYFYKKEESRKGVDFCGLRL